MAPIYAHIGAMKTGTTFIQLLLLMNRAALAEAGFHLPSDWRGRSLEGARRKPRPGDAQRREELLAELREHTGQTSLLSRETLSCLGRDRAHDLIAQLPTDDFHAVLTVRDANATLPAQWQTMCRNQSRVPWRRFASDVDAWLENGRASRSTQVFQRTQDVGRMLDVWASMLGSGHVHVVTVPPPGSDPFLLWRRFAEAIGIDHSVLTTRDVPRNPTLGWPSCELLRRLNVQIRDVDKDRYNRVVRAVVAHALAGRVAEEPPIWVGGRVREIAGRWNRQNRDAIIAARVPIVGSLDDLPDTATGERADDDVASPADDQLLAAAATARDALRRLEIALVDDGPLDAALPTTTQADHWEGQPDPIDAAVLELANRVRRCVEVDPGRRRLDPYVGLS
jgi:hypothetical protein